MDPQNSSMPLKGNLESVDLGNVLQMLAMNQREGTMMLFDGDSRRSIYFAQDGISMLSRGRRVQDSLGNILLRSGKVSPETIQEALAKQQAEGKRLGDVLRELGAVTQEDVDAAVRTQIEEEIYNLFIWKEAQFEFVEGPPPPPVDGAPAPVKFEIATLVQEGQRRADEWNYIRGLVPSLDEIYRPTEKLPDATAEIFQPPWAARLREQLKRGKLNVSELCESAFAPKFESCKLLSTLQEQGAVEPASLADLQGLSNEAATAGDHKQSAKFLSRIVDLGGATPAVNMSLGYALEALDEPERASIYFKAAAEAFSEVGEPQQAFEAYQRVVRVLPTDLAAVTAMVEVACNNPPILEASTAEVVEAGRTLAMCMKELGRLPAAVQVLHKLAKTAPTDLPLRNMLIQAYVDGGMTNEAMGELESLADVFAAEKNYDEAIRCLRKVIGIDRNRAGVLKKIEAWTRARDSGKRAVMRWVIVGTSVGVIGAVAWGGWYLKTGAQKKREEAQAAISAALDPLRANFDSSEKDFEAAVSRLENWKASTTESVAADAKAVEAALAAMEGGIRAIASKTQEISAERGPGAFETSNPVEEQTAVRRKRLDGVDGHKERKNRVFSAISEDAKSSYRKERVLAETQPLGRIPEVERIVGLLNAVEPPKQPKLVQVGNKLEDVAQTLDRLYSYRKEVQGKQQESNELWTAGKLRDSHMVLATYLKDFYTVTEFAETLRFHVRLTTIPDKATLKVKEGFRKGDAIVSPQDLEYTALGGLSIEVSAPGFLTVTRVIEPVKGVIGEKDLVEKLPYELRVVLPKVPVWSTALGTGGIESAPVPTVDGTGLVVSDRDGWVHVLNLSDGKKAQSVDAHSPSGFQSSPVVTADSVYAASADGVILALDFPSLQTRWRKEAAEGPGPVYGAPVLAEGLLVAAGPSGTMTAWDAKTGEQKWDRKLESGTREPLLLARGWIVAACEDGRLRVVSLDGQESITVLPSAKEETTYTAQKAHPLMVGEKVLIGLDGVGQEFAYIELPVPGAASPHIGYRWGVKEEGAEVSGAVAGPDDLLLLFSNGMVHRVPHRQGPRSGEKPSRAIAEKERPVDGPALHGGLVYISGEKSLSALRPVPGEYQEVWKWTTTAAPITTAPVHAGKLVVVCSRDGKVHALLRD